MFDNQKSNQFVFESEGCELPKWTLFLGTVTMLPDFHHCFFHNQHGHWTAMVNTYVLFQDFTEKTDAILFAFSFIYF